MPVERGGIVRSETIYWKEGDFKIKVTVIDGEVNAPTVSLSLILDNWESFYEFVAAIRQSQKDTVV